MEIRKTRIRNIFPYIRFIKNGERFTIGVKLLDNNDALLSKIGFNNSPSVGDTILPSGSFGPISSFNAEGKQIKLTDQPMETFYTQRLWTWEEFNGPYDRVEQSKIVDVPHERYPRKFIPPPSVQFTLAKIASGDLVIISPVFEKTTDKKEEIEHAVNLFLEIFGKCQFFTENVEEYLKIPIRTLNWKILPPGKRPWPELHGELNPIIKHAPKGNQFVIEHRLETINKYKPDFAAIGEGGFHGYVILGFTDKNLYTLESLYYGNATYVFGEQWEELSKMTKAQILNDNLQKDRIIHRESWEDQISKVLEIK